MKLIDASTAHQIFGRAGRPQFDTQGFVYALAHEDDVKIARWKEKYDQIPDNTKDPGLLKAKKALKKKQPTRRTTEQYWSESQFRKLIEAPPTSLASRGPLPWRLLAYMLDASPEVEHIRQLVGKRLLPPAKLDAAQRDLNQSLITLWRAGYVDLEPKPGTAEGSQSDSHLADKNVRPTDAEPRVLTAADLTFSTATKSERHNREVKEKKEQEAASAYRPEFAYPTERLPLLLAFRSVNPLYGVFLINQLGIADRAERLQAMESVLEMPGTVARYVRVPKQEELPPGPLATQRLDDSLLRLGLVTAEQLGMKENADEEDRRPGMFEERVWILTLADKLKLQFDFDFPGIEEVRITPVWVAGPLLEFGGDFNKLITARGLQKQEGMIFRHLLRLILLLGEFRQIAPAEVPPEEWQAELDEISQQLVRSCAAVDPTSTEHTLEQVHMLAERPADL
jgi:hypothetical protein